MGGFLGSPPTQTAEGSKTISLSSRDRAIIEIRNLILVGEIKAHQRVVEADLAQRLGISRTPVREAFRELVQLGLLVGEYHKGVRVADIGLETIRHVYEVRSDLESFAAELAAVRITDEEIEQLARLNDEMRQPNPGVGIFSSLNDQFHRILNQATRNHVLVDLVADLRTRVRAIRMLFHYHPVLMAESVRQHDEVVSALADRSPTAAREAMRRHVKSGITQLIIPYSTRP